mgnify:CR=1 FL=1
MAMPSASRANRDILATIAAEVGVSTRTVYRVLNEREGEVWSSAATRGDRIRAMAKKLGYRPNLAARSTRTGRFSQIAFIMGIGDTVSSFSHVLLKGMHDGLAAAEVALVAARLPDELLASGDRLPAILGSLSVDGLMLLYNKPETPAMRAALDGCGLPQVWLNERRAHDAVCYDDRQGTALAVERLRALGHRRIAYLAGALSRHYSGPERRDGYRDGMRGLPAQEAILDGDDPLHARVERWLRSAAPRPTAAVCYGLDDGLALMLAAARIGIAVPEQLSIVCCGHDESRPGGAAFSRVYSEAYDFGADAAALMLRKLEEPRRRQPLVVRPYLWWEAGTTAAPPPA